MSDILVEIANIPGESTFKDKDVPIEAGLIECTSVRHVIDLPVVSTSSDRTEGTSEHGAYELTHSIDKATPLLREAMSKGSNLGVVKIYIMRPIGGKSKPGQVITLDDAYVVEVRVDTPLNPGTDLSPEESPEAGLPSEEPQEMFALVYSGIQWDIKKVVGGEEKGTISGNYDLSAQAAT